MLHYLVFTDLDGTLLDSRTYSYQKSLTAINRLKENGIPIIFCSAKTRAEQEIYRRELGLPHPFIVENGSAIFIPRAYFPFSFDYHKAVNDLLAIELAIPYSRVRRLLAKIGKENDFHFAGFGDMSAAEVAETTGLNPAFAELAKHREYDEPVRFDSSGEKALSMFLAKIEEFGLNWSYGGRLYHVMGGGGKGKAVEILATLYRRMWGDIRTVGLGNGLNDSPMLSQVDIPILVQKRDHNWEDIDLPRLRKVQGVGPEGWSRAIAQIFGE
ncbi:MAG TPA: mannosyl-3-phosphoglycerate phosphatase [Dehalococcoidia bacterium]|nr:mannosyl-3-phosphoglycerate phosphatase [Dehalococcoidia bacterium]